MTANVACTVLASPDGVVEVCPRKGPITVDATFWPNSSPTLVDYIAPYVYLVRPKKTGTCELIVLPAGGTVVRQMLKVTVGPAPPPPGPAPPVPPVPLLVKSLQDAYAAEGDGAKAMKIAALSDLYGAAVAAARASGAVTTLAQLQTKVHAAADLAVGSGALPAVRKVVSIYIASQLPAIDGPMTDALWTTAAGAYSDVGKALKEVK